MTIAEFIKSLDALHAVPASDAALCRGRRVAADARCSSRRISRRTVAPLLELGAASLTIQVLAMLLPMFSKFVIDEVIVPQRQRWLAAALAGVFAAVLLQSGGRRGPASGC